MESKGEEDKMNLELHYTGLLRLSRLDLTVSFSIQVSGRETTRHQKATNATSRTRENNVYVNAHWVILLRSMI